MTTDTGGENRKHEACEDIIRAAIIVIFVLFVRLRQYLAYLFRLITFNMAIYPTFQRDTCASCTKLSLSRGQQWLDRNSPSFVAETQTGQTFKDNFVELLMLEATGNW